MSDFTALLCSRGPDVAEDVVFAALEDMAAKIERLRLLWSESQLEDLRPLARRLHKISDGAGLTSLSAAVEAFRGAVTTENAVTMSATFQRIDRCLDASVETIWRVFDEN
ncbi:hypothetical protein SAMN05444003_1902 [Cognatiyoonia sediminum]|uniref:Hpt domain-containing protein n=1 Tax=Cognatiyoonia sediminum TaxID=1508389 RepID=A0A1M5PXK3_9RHOB|nr:hypothetical protein [Cognatiyoonia sediminum]SHH06382.1 hypothetical protein SAMN05444003_1902 [Cognatiyoonia sediminum]